MVILDYYTSVVGCCWPHCTKQRCRPWVDAQIGGRKHEQSLRGRRQKKTSDGDIESNAQRGKKSRQCSDLQTKKAINLGVNTTRRCRCTAIRSQQEAALRNYFTQGCCSFGLVRRSRANQRLCLPVRNNPFRFNPLKQRRLGKSLFTCTGETLVQLFST